MRQRLAPMLVFALVVTACSGESRGSDLTEATSTTPTPQSIAGTTSSAGPSDPKPVFPTTTRVETAVYLSDQMIERVVSQAADEIAADPEEFAVEVAMRVTWSDGSLGCPQLGQSYTQALVDGYWVVLSRNGEKFDYRAGDALHFQRCRNGSPPAITYVDR